MYVLTQYTCADKQISKRKTSINKMSKILLTVNYKWNENCWKWQNTTHNV